MGTALARSDSTAGHSYDLAVPGWFRIACFEAVALVYLVGIGFTAAPQQYEYTCDEPSGLGMLLGLLGAVFLLPVTTYALGPRRPRWKRGLIGLATGLVALVVWSFVFDSNSCGW